ncbi:MAG: single-stranded-DNA-specific exonuclease RecJ [Holosporales bacterium]|jgi:single-stranded-DNA-specific exonuclease|nr:single-stranded-DNA-specific exonuclease RecJ [Holosporales bacterium]
MNISFFGKTWIFLDPDKEKLERIKLSCDIDDLVARILINRNVDTPEEVKNFLNPTLRNAIPDPSLLIDMDKGVQRVVKAINSNENIIIFGDYDADGITSSYIVIQYLRILGLQPKYYIPSRFSDGYGISSESIKLAISQNVELIIALDCGINSIEEIDEANKFGIDSVIIDHHVQLRKEVPNAAAVINPNRADQNEIEKSHIKKLCAAGVAFLFLIALQRELRNINFFPDKKEPNLRDFIDAVALGTLCDVMEIRGMNRAIIKYCLKSGRYSIGISSLMKAFNIPKINSTNDLLFFIGPAINAAGRVGDPHLALNLFLAENIDSADRIAMKLLELNEERKLMEKQLLAEVNLMINTLDLQSNNGICVFGNNWHEGILGIIAGRIKDKYKKASFVISFNKNGIGKGAARSVAGVNLANLLDIAKENNIIISGGGHALAGGFSIYKDKIDEFKTFINDNIQLTNQNIVEIDCSISAQCDINKLSETLSILEPFGKGIENPTVCIKRLKIRFIKKIGNGNHMSILFSDEFNKSNIRSVIFNTQSKKTLLDSIESNKDAILDIIGQINQNEQFGSSVIIEDIRISA